MKLLQWNIQWCRGADGVVDPERIARTARGLGDPDLCCFQEVAENFPALAGSAGENQPELLGALFPGYSAHFACAVDVPDGAGGRRRFGNLILSRLPVERVLRHSLPWPAHEGVPSMPRVALEAVIEAPWGPLRVTTTHLEYYSELQRAAQVARLRSVHREALGRALSGTDDRYREGPFAPLARPASAILCGDFNMRPDDPLMRELLEDFRDAWRIGNPGAAHPATFRVHEKERDEAPYCCDYVLVSPDLASRLVCVQVDPDCVASDHQPVIVRFRP